MRAVRLATIMLQAEQLRFRRVLRRRLYQGGLLMLALGLLLVAAVAGEMALYTLLAARLEPAGAAGCLAGGNALVALLLAAVALAASPGAVEREAEALAGAARSQIRQSLSWTRVVALMIGRLTGRR